ncbi:MAG: Holliday junction resolvase RuvX [Patescibacteria group bacterium]|nr:Holliday junction resolvase RuvX [Patescibacteria group bacterium]
MRYIGIDYGSKKIGIALSDERGSMGFPRGILPNTPRLVEELCALIREEGVGTAVFGESRTLAGGENPIAADARAFAKQLRERAGIPVFFEPEMYTSAEARRAPAKEGKSRKPATRENVDASAAALILTSYLNRKNQTTGNSPQEPASP